MIEHLSASYNIDQLKVSKVPKITDLTKLEAGGAFFLALKQKIRPAIKEWSMEQLSEFIAETAFFECCNTIKYSKITGAKLIEDLSTEFLWHTLGIIGDNE